MRGHPPRRPFVPSRPPVVPRMRGGAAVVSRPLAPTPQFAPPVPSPALDAAPATWPWKGVTWSPIYIALLLYTHVVITYAFPIGDVAVATGLLGLLLLGRPPRVPLPLLLLGGLLAVAAAGLATTQFPTIVGDELLGLAKVWLIVLVAVNAINTRPQARFYVIFLLGCFALYPLRGAYFNYFVYRAMEVGRIAWNHIFDNPNDLASFAMVPLGLSVGLLMTEKHKIIRRCAQAGAVMIPLMIFLTQSRGGILGLAVFLVGTLAGTGKRLKYLMVATFATVVIAVFAPSSVWSRLRNLKNVTSEETIANADDRGSAEQRYEIWRVAWTVSKENPVLGVGIGAYQAAHRLTATRPTFKSTARGARDAHSTYLSMLAETGVLGFLFFLATVGSILAYSMVWRRRIAPWWPHTARQLYFGELGFIAYLACGVFGTYGRVSLTFLFFFTFWAFVDSIRRDFLATMTSARQGAPA